MTEALITPNIIIWARERSQISLNYLSKSLGIQVKKIQAWENGEYKPTFKQAQDLAKKLHIPFGYLFLKTPPLETLTIPDLRTVQNEELENISIKFRDLLNDIQRKQSWYRQYMIENEEDFFPYLGQFSINDGVELVSDAIKKALNISKSDRNKCRDKKKYFKLLSDKVEELGVLVMRNSIVGSNTHRSLDVNEFRGFALSDKYAPLIFINSSDANSAKIFTLIHELAHLWIDESGISSVALDRVDNNKIEQFCNEVSAEVLVPKEDFFMKWDKNLSISYNIATLANNFNVSTFVIIRRAWSLKLISKSSFDTYYSEANNNFMSYLNKEKIKKKKSSGNYYDTTRTRLGNQFSRAVVVSVLEGRTLYRDGGNLLNINPSNLMKFAQNLKVIK